jgi:hypothetical protein
MARTPTTLSRGEGYQLTDSKQGARLNVHTMITHTGVYAWQDAHDCWVLDRAERIVKASGSAGTFVWSRTTKTFVRQ